MSGNERPKIGTVAMLATANASTGSKNGIPQPARAVQVARTNNVRTSLIMAPSIEQNA